MLSADSRKWTICNKPECRYRNVVDSLRTRFSASRWLWQFRNDSEKLTSMRSAISQRPTVPGARLSDQEFLDKLADLLATGNLHVHAPEEEDSGGGGSQTAAVDERPPFPLSERKPRIPPRSSREAVDDPPTLPADCDLAMQGATLTTAADRGAAFCDI